MKTPILFALVLSGCITTPCSSGTQTCNETCVDISTDRNNCGGCGFQCPSGSYCSDGQCSCSSGTFCGQNSSGICIDTQTNEDHCGSCGKSCGYEQSCESGDCCTDKYGSCTKSSDCCSDLSCYQGSCKSCKAEGDACKTQSDCCGTLKCLSGSCQTCAQVGSACSTESDCCGTTTSCYQGSCNTCHDKGSSCSSSSDCCGSYECIDGFCGSCDDPTHPVYCAVFGGGCWSPTMVCSTAVRCPDGSEHGCSSSTLRYDCATNSCK